MIPGLSSELLNAAKALGLLTPDGGLNADWFSDPSQSLLTVLSNKNQRTAFLALLDDLMPPEPVPGTAAGEKWHPLLGPQPRGNLYLTAKNGSSPFLTIGLGGQITGGGALPASLRVRMPLARFGQTNEAIAGTGNGPLEISLRLTVNWVKGASHAIGLKAARVDLSVVVAPNPSIKVKILLEGLNLDGTGAKDTLLDPDALGPEAVKLIVGLIGEKLRTPSSPGAEATAAATHLLGLLGLDGTVPPLPLTSLTNGGATFQGWLNSLTSQPVKMKAWLQHFAGLFGANVSASGNGTLSDPWRMPITPIGTGALNLTVASASGRLHFGLEVALLPNAASPRIEGQATIVAIPLAGNAAPLVLPSATVLLKAPGTGNTALVNAPGTIVVSSLAAGFGWNGSDLAAVFELLDVQFQGTSYPKIDLTSADSVAAAASGAVQAAILNALGNAGAGRRLAALAGLVAPSSDPTADIANLAVLVSDPAHAIAAVHRKALITPAHHWGNLFAELVGLVGLNTPVTGTGTRQNPWRTALAPAGGLSLELAAWNEQTSGVASDPQKLRIGLRAAANAGGWSFSWLCELLACDLPASGAADVHVMGGQHVALLLNQIPAIPSKAGFDISASTFGVTMDWVPGGSLQMHGMVTGLSVTSNGTTVNVPSLEFPTAGPIDVMNPVTLNIALPQFEALVRMLLSRAAASWGGVPGFTAAAFLGLHRNLPGLPANWPELRDPGAAGSMFNNPPAALRDWFMRVATGVTPDGRPMLPMAMAWLAAVLKDELPGTLAGGADLSAVRGAGVYENPWSFSVTPETVRPLELLAWLEPAGPPSAWAAPLAAQFAGASSLQGLLAMAGTLAPFLPQVSDALTGVDVSNLGAALFSLNAFFVSSDGVVPSASQMPTGGLWTSGTVFECSHDKQPAHASAISQSQLKIAGWNAGQRAVLLIGAAFEDKSAWTAWLAAAPGVKNAAAHFNLRQPGVPPENIDLAPVSVVADYYTADLFDDGSGDLTSLTAQIGRVVDRIKVLKPGLKVTIVAHSTAGIAARQYAAGNAVSVAGLVTIGAPHAGTPLTPILDESVATAIRLIRSMGVTLPAGSIQDAFNHLIKALDQYLPPVGGLLPAAAPYPVASFASPAGTDTGAVPAFALASKLNSDLLGQLKQGFAVLATAAAAVPRPAPTHLAFGFRNQLLIPGAAGDAVGVDARVRADAFRIGLTPGLPQPARPEHSITVNIGIGRTNGWLLGSAISHGDGAPDVEARVRRAELGATIVPQAGAVQVTPFVRLYDAGWHGPAAPKLELGNAAVESLLGGLFQAISPATLGIQSGISILFDALDALGLVVPAQGGGYSLSAEAFAAIQVDAAGFLLPHLGAALDGPDGIVGIKGPYGGPYVLPAPIGPFELYVSRTGGWRVGLRTSSPLSLALGTLDLDASVALPTFAPALNLTLQFGAVALVYSQATGNLTLTAPPWVDLTLIPMPAPAVFTSTLNAALPRLLLSAAASPILEAAMGGVLPMGPIDGLLGAPGGSMQKSEATGDGNGFDGAKINGILEKIAQIAGLPSSPGITLPGGVQLTASGTGDVTFALTTLNPIGGVLGLSLTATIDSSRHMTPGGTATLHVVPGGTWGSVDVAFGATPAGVSLVVTPQGIPPIQLLPAFSGLGSLAGAADTLLTSALDAMDGQTMPAWYPTLRTVANKLGLYGPTYAAHADSWKKLLAGQFLALMTAQQKADTATALVAYLQSMGGIPGVFSRESDAAVWTSPALGAGGTVKVKAGWKSGLPMLQVAVTDLKFPGGPLKLNFSAGVVPPGADPVTCSMGVALDLLSSAGLAVKPEFVFTRIGGTYECKLLPLGTANEADFKVRFAPSGASPVTLTNAGIGLIGSYWVLPLITSVLMKAGDPLSRKLWTNGKSVQDLLTYAKILPGPMPSLQAVIGNILTGMGSGAGIEIPISTNPPLAVGFTSSGGVFGIRFKGTAEFTVGEIKVGVLFGGPSAVATEPDAGISLLLFNQALQFKPRLRVIGLGLSFSKAGGAPLIALPIFRLGSFAGSVFFEMNLTNFTFTNNPAFGAGVDLGGVSIPLGQAMSGGGGDSNPVASSMLQSDDTAGKPQPPAPTLDVIITYKNNAFKVQFAGAASIWIPIHKSFGPIYIDQIGLELLQNFTKMAILIDGSVKISGLTVQADDLGVMIPFKSLSKPGDWSLELRGLAVSYVGDGISILGGLRKNPGPPIQYDGMLSVEVAGKGFTAVGSYARPTDAQGAYTSLFIFVSLPIPLGGPPCFFVTGLGGGAGINRQLIVPKDIEKVPEFFLVQAIDDPSFGNDPMGALLKLGPAVPPKRGAFWFAAGVRFTSFVIVHSVAVIYVALDRGFEIGILGVSRMALPTDDLALASVELALKARFSSSEGILSIQAQLTENSYILTKECRLTGGFAFFVWFPKGQFVLTLGGYHKAFKAPKEFPVVPRLGFRMRTGPVVVKGESYFALTNSCVMAGGRLEVAYDLGWVRAWFAAWADFLISWDPFYYDIDIGVEIGVSVHLHVCFIFCGDIDFDLSIGAEVHIFGPALHADVTIDLTIVSFTISFGADPDNEPDYIQSWTTFRDKYVTTGDDKNKGVTLRVTDGLLTPDPPGAEPAPGTKSQPWRLNAEFAFQTETQMPAMSWSTFAGSSGGKVSEAAQLQIAAMNKLSITSDHNLALFIGDTNNAPVIVPGHFRMTAVIKPFPEATWKHKDKQHAAANTLPAIAGLKLVGAALLRGQSKLIPISTMIDDIPSLSLPLPFATLTVGYMTVIQDYGTIASKVWIEISLAPSPKMLAGAGQILSGAGTFAELRVKAGLPAGGLSPMAQKTLMTRRSAPPLVLSLTTGMNMLPPGLAMPPLIYQVPETRPVALKRIRLVAVLQGRLTPTADAPAAIHTSVLQVTGAKDALRMAPPRLMVLAGARLKRVPPMKAPRPTRSASAFRTVLSPQLGVCSSVLHSKEFEKAAEMVLGEGVAVPAGTTHVWEIPLGKTFVTITGAAAARVVCLAAGGRILGDVELVAEGQTLPVPAETSTVAVTCLGRLPRELKGVTPAFAAVTMAAAAARGFSGVGWELNDTREQIGTTVLLGRGATMVLGRPYYSAHRGQKTHWSMVRIAAAAREQRGVETRLPIGVRVVMVILDGRDSCAAERGDLAIGCDGATLVTPAIPVGGGHRRAVLYDVTDVNREKDYFTVSVVSEEGWRVAGVVGLQGRALEWATRLHGRVPEDMVPNGPLTPFGAVRVRFGGEPPKGTPPVTGAGTKPGSVVLTPGTPTTATTTAPASTATTKAGSVLTPSSPATPATTPATTTAPATTTTRIGDAATGSPASPANPSTMATKAGSAVPVPPRTPVVDAAVTDKAVIDKTVIDKTVIDKTVIDKTVIDAAALKIDSSKITPKTGDKK